MKMMHRFHSWTVLDRDYRYSGTERCVLGPSFQSCGHLKLQVDKIKDSRQLGTVEGEAWTSHFGFLSPAPSFCWGHGQLVTSRKRDSCRT